MENEEVNIRQMHHDEALLSWSAPEFIHHERDLKWYILASVVIFGIVAFSLYRKDWFFLVILPFILAGTYVYLKSSPITRNYGITRTGVFIDNQFYSYDVLHSFWVVYNNAVKTLNLIPNKKYVPAISIQLDDQDPTLIKNILKKFLPQEERTDENYADKITRLLKF